MQEVPEVPEVLKVLVPEVLKVLVPEVLKVRVLMLPVGAGERENARPGPRGRQAAGG